MSSWENKTFILLIVSHDFLGPYIICSKKMILMPS